MLAGLGCTSTSAIHWNRLVDTPAVLEQFAVFVMEPLVEGSAAPGNVGRNMPVVQPEVRERPVAIISERSTVVDVVVTSPRSIPALARYPAAMSGAKL